MPKFQLTTLGGFMLLAKMSGKSSPPANVAGFKSVTTGEGDSGDGAACDANCAADVVPSVEAGVLFTLGWNGGLPRASLTRLPYTRSLNTPMPPRIDVLPFRNGSHAKPSLGSKLR